jgi:DNA-binding NtrC family response regulator
VALPALRSRPGDILPLARLFADKFSEQNDLPRKEFSESAIKKLEAYHWPGNIRELENTMHRTVLLSQQTEIEDTAVMLSGQADSMAQTYADNIVAGTKDKTEIAPKQAEAGIPAESPSPAPAENSDEDTDSINVFVGKTVADVERELIISTLDHCLGNRTHAAKILGISIRTLRKKINQYSEQGVAVPES